MPLSFSIAQPQDVTVKNGNVTTKLKWNGSFASQKSAAFSRAQMFVDQEIIRYMDPQTPRLTGAMIRSVTIGSAIGSGHLVYASPYARRQYYEHKSKGKWFEKVKSAHGATIREGAAKIIESGS